MTQGSLALLLTEAAPHTDGLESVLELAAGGFAIQFSDGTNMRVDIGPDGRTVVTAPLGHAPMTRMLDCYATMLNYNTLWPETGGGWMGRDATDGELLLMADLVGIEDAAALAGMLGNMRGIAEGWRAYLAAEVPAPEEELAVPAFAMLRG